MGAPARRDVHVLIVGAGPTGLVLALWLTRMGVRVRIIDKTAQPGTTSRALAVQARTLEFYDQAGFADAVLEDGVKAVAMNLWVAGNKKGRAVFGEMGKGLSPFPYAIIYPQDEHERMLIEQLAAVGVEVERQTELVDFQDARGRVSSRVKRPDGTIEEVESIFIAGCDGAHSVVRETLHIGFPGGVYTHLYYVADVQAGGLTMDGELHLALDTSDFMFTIPLKGAGRARLIGTVRDELENQQGLSWDDVSKSAIEKMHLNVERVNWFSTYRVHHRVADRFRIGRAFILGDAAHVHSPVGGQGMNTGIGDAVNLAWKLAAVLQERADVSILDSYQQERIAFARRLVATTDKAFTGVTSRSALARLWRLHLVPLVIAPLFKLAAVRRLMFRTVSQITLNYRGSSLSEGRAGKVHGGDRLPWLGTGTNGEGPDNFRPLTSMDWQVHVYGDAESDLRMMCKARNLPLHVFPWRSQMGRAGLHRDALYLVRPDGYVALADQEGRATELAVYLHARNITAAPIRSERYLATTPGNTL
jgi:2-polyprenyl-6-methoxyphenol hydroxylase-like FAD-dependent oxidoreductase